MVSGSVDVRVGMVADTDKDCVTVGNVVVTDKVDGVGSVDVPLNVGDFVKVLVGSVGVIKGDSVWDWEGSVMVWEAEGSETVELDVSVDEGRVTVSDELRVGSVRVVPVAVAVWRVVVTLTVLDMVGKDSDGEGDEVRVGKVPVGLTLRDLEGRVHVADSDPVAPCVGRVSEKVRVSVGSVTVASTVSVSVMLVEGESVPVAVTVGSVSVYVGVSSVSVSEGNVRESVGNVTVCVAVEEA